MNINVVNSSEGTTKADLIVVFETFTAFTVTLIISTLAPWRTGPNCSERITYSLANASQEMKEGDFLDLVDASGNVTMQGNGVAGVNANAKAEGLSSPAIGYWFS
jgi:hypothetical protein